MLLSEYILFVFILPLFLLFRLIVRHNSLRYPLGKCLTVVLEHEALLVARVADVAQLEVDSGGLCVAKHIEVTFAHRTVEPSARQMAVIQDSLFRNVLVKLHFIHRGLPNEARNIGSRQQQAVSANIERRFKSQRT